MDKPDVDYIEGLSPAISIDQKTTSRNPRSTVGTVTEIYDYMRLLFARIENLIAQIAEKLLNGRQLSRLSIMFWNYLKILNLWLWHLWCAAVRVNIRKF